MRRSLFLILATAAVAACAPTGGGTAGARFNASEGGARQCFAPDRVSNFRGGDTDQIYVRATSGGVFAIRSAGCPDIRTAHSLSLSPGAGISNQLCVGDSARIMVANTGFGSPQCQARVERSLTEAEVEALPSRQRP